MGEEDLRSKLGLDTTDFKTQISTINREIRVLESGFRASAAGLGDWGNKSSGLEMRIKSLNGQFDLQQLKVKALEEEYKRIAAEKGANSQASQNLQIKLNQETEKLGKTKTSVGKMLRRLIKTDCLEPYKIKSGYIITAKGQFVISYIKLLDQYSGGKNNGR